MQPRVTVLLAHHNYQQYLADALRSAKEQTYPVHICVIDDCSTDKESVNSIVMNKLFNNDEANLNVVVNEQYGLKQNLKNTVIFLSGGPYGPSYARNRGIEECWDKSDLFITLDADDEMLPTKVEKFVDVFLEDPNNIGAIYGDYYILNVETQRKTIEFKEPFDIIRLQQECIVHSGSMMNKQALAEVKEKTGFYDETMRTCEDYDLWMRISDHYMIYHIPEPLSLVRVQPQNSTDSVKQEIWNRNWRKVAEKAQQRYANT